MDNGYRIREKNLQDSKVWAFWACKSAAQTKSICDEKNVADTLVLTWGYEESKSKSLKNYYLIKFQLKLVILDQ